MLSVLSLFVLAVCSQPVELLDPVLIQGTYEEQYDRARNTYSVWRVDDFTTDAWGVHQARLFRTGTIGADAEDDEDVYVGTSKYDNYKTFLGEQPIYAWDSDEKGWSIMGTHPNIRSGAIDYQAVVNYFQTADGKTWAYDALWQIQNNTLRSTAITSGVGPSYILAWDNGFSSTPSYTHTTAFATEDATYFRTQDNREFLWTFSWGQSNSKRNAAPPNCTLIEYTTGGSWVTSDGRFIGCNGLPRAPLVFTNVDGRAIYAFTSSGPGGVLFLDYNPSSKNFTRVDLMDNLALPGLIKAWHWVDTADNYGSFDMITAITQSNGVITVRLHWDIHWAETLPAVRVSQGVPNDLDWIFPNEGRRCFIIGGAERGYGGLQTTPSSIYSWYMEVWCWDQARDVWDNSLRIPHEAAWFNQAFRDPEDDNNWWLVTMQQHHVVNSAMKTYHFAPMDDEDVRIRIRLETGAEIADDTQWRAHDTRHIVIATLSIVAFTLILALLTLFLLASGGGGGGGSGDYSKFN
jgi:hypothetical protein